MATNVLDHGAIGDGTTDDTAAFRAALAKPGKVVVPVGRYRLTSGLAIRDASGVTIEGEGLGSVLLFDGAYPEAIRCENTSYLTVRDLWINGPKTVGRGLHVTQKGASAEGVLIENVHVDGFGDGLSIGADTAGDVAEVTILHCWAVNAANAGFVVGNGTGGNVLDIRFLGCIARNNAIGVLGRGAVYTWRDGSVGGNSQVDFRQLGPNGAPLVISGVRSEHSRRFLEVLGGGTYFTPVTVESVVVQTFHDPDGCAIAYDASYPLTLRDVAICGGPRPCNLALGFDPAHPLAATFVNVFTDSASPFGTPGPHQQFTVIGGGTIGPDGQAVAAGRGRGIATTGITLDSDATLEFGDGRRWTPGGFEHTQTMRWVGADKAAIWAQGGELWCETPGPTQPGRGGINGNPPPRVTRLSKP